MLWSWPLAVVLVLAGFAGIVLPGLPGAILIFAGLWLVAWADGYMRVGAGTIVVLGMLTALMYVLDLATMALGMRRLGVTRPAMVGAALGLAVGLFFGVVGLIVGPFAGAVIGELIALRAGRSGSRGRLASAELRRVGRAGMAAWIGVVLGMAAKLGLAVGMVGLFLAAWFF